MSVETETGLAPSATSQKVFICYRREETAPYAGRLYDAMVSRFGEGNVFMDVDLAPGVDFERRITEVVSGCVALLIVMGPNWAETSEDGRRRIDNPADFVRLEVETGLHRSEVTPIPVLVGGARMPRREDLPPEIRDIARRNAIELSNGRWSYDVGRLMETLKELLPDAQPVGGPAPSPPPAPSEPISLGWRLVGEGMLLAGGTAVVGRLVGQLLPDGGKAMDSETGREVAEHVGAIVMRRTETLALIGAVLAIWLARRVWQTNPIRHLARGLLTGALAGLLGGLIWGLAVYLPVDKLTFSEKAHIELVAIAVSGGILGSLIGWLWRPRRTGPGFIAGAVGGLLFQLLVIVSGWENSDDVEVIVSFAVAAAMIVGAALMAMIGGDRSENRTGLERGPG
jgi:TIR domain